MSDRSRIAHVDTKRALWVIESTRLRGSRCACTHVVVIVRAQATICIAASYTTCTLASTRIAITIAVTNTRRGSTLILTREFAAVFCTPLLLDNRLLSFAFGRPLDDPCMQARRES